MASPFVLRLLAILLNTYIQLSEANVYTHDDLGPDRLISILNSQSKRLQQLEKVVTTQESELTNLKVNLEQQASQNELLLRGMDTLNEALQKQVRKTTELEGRLLMEKQKNQDLQTVLRKVQSTTEVETVSEEPSPVHNTVLKRSDDFGAVAPVVSQMSQQLTEMSAEIQAIKNINSQQDLAIAAQGTTYIRWGHASCPGAAELVYSGSVGGSLYSSPGSAANNLCLPPHPVFGTHQLPRMGPAELYGSEYQTCDEPECNTTPVCAVCHIHRDSAVMIPGTNNCTNGWTLEYWGYIMAGWPAHARASEFICVDQSLGYLPSSQANYEQNLLHYTVYRCGNLPCPPYVDGKTVLCAVCSK